MAIMQYVFGSFNIGVPKRIATASRHLNLHDILPQSLPFSSIG